MPKKKTDEFMTKLGSWAFIIGVLLAVFASLTGFDSGQTLLVLGVFFFFFFCGRAPPLCGGGPPAPRPRRGGVRNRENPRVNSSG